MSQPAECIEQAARGARIQSEFIAQMWPMDNRYYLSHKFNWRDEKN